MITARPAALLTLAAGLFGISATGTKWALRGFGPVTVLTVELVAATAVLWVLLLRRGYRRPVSWPRVLLLGALEPGLAYLLFSFGLTHTSASNEALLSGLESGFVVLLASIFLSERAGWSVIAAITIAAAGMVVLEGSTRFAGPGLGDLLVAGGALSAASYTVIARRLSPDDDSLTVTTHQFTAALAIILPLAMFRFATGAESVPSDVPAPYWLVAALVGILGFGASFVLYNAAIVHIAAGAAGVIINLAPAFGLASAVLVLGERLTAERAIGAGLIAMSVAVFVAVEYRNTRGGRSQSGGSSRSRRTAARSGRRLGPSVGIALTTTMSSGIDAGSIIPGRAALINEARGWPSRTEKTDGAAAVSSREFDSFGCPARGWSLTGCPAGCAARTTRSSPISSGRPIRAACPTPGIDSTNGSYRPG